MKLKITCAFLALAGSSFGALIQFTSVGANYDGTDDYGVLLSTGTPVASGAGLVQIGYFTSLDDTQVAGLASSQDYSTLFAPGSFAALAVDDFTGIDSAYGPTAGFVVASASGVNPVPGIGKTLYAYITSGTELGLFNTGTPLAADPALPSPEANYFLSFASGQAVIGAFGPDYTVDYSAIGGGTVDVNSFQLINPIPEPSAALLGAFGVLGLLRRRRN